ncbi:MAG: zf-HC2 domain-containing protein [Anaerolineales bacterium]
MRCSHPPPLTPDQLSAALDGEAGPAILDHLAGCPGCAARLERVRQVEQRLGRQLYRWDCATPEQLGDYQLGVLAEAEAFAIARHLEGCTRCREELDDLRAFLAAEARPRAQRAQRGQPQPARGPGSHGIPILARLLPPPPTPALRGEARGPITAEAGGVTIVLDLQPAAEGRVRLLGQLAAEDQDRWTGALVQLWQAGALQTMARVDDLGGFHCEGIAPGLTDIRITPQMGRTLVLPDVELIA